MIVSIAVTSIFSRSSKSLSPIIRCVALLSTANDKRKLSFGSRQIPMWLVTLINSARRLIWRNIFCKSLNEKYFYFGLLATSINSSSSSWLKIKIRAWSKNILSSFSKSFVSKKLIQRLVSTITLSFIFGITL